MPNFNIASEKLRARPVSASDIPAINTMSRGPSLDFMGYASGPRQYQQRQAVGGAVASAVNALTLSLNEGALHVWAQRWLSKNESTILERLRVHHHRVFVLQVNFSVSRSPAGNQFAGREIHFLGTVEDTTRVGEILTPTRLYGPRADAVPVNNLMTYHYAYLIGQMR